MADGPDGGQGGDSRKEVVAFACVVTLEMGWGVREKVVPGMTAGLVCAVSLQGFLASGNYMGDCWSSWP